MTVARAASGRSSDDLPRFDITLADFKMLLPRDTLHAGGVRLVFTNEGPTGHEAVLVRTDAPADGLPLKDDAFTVDEDAAGLEEIVAVEDIPLWEAPSANVVLAPGHYVLFCNLEGHYLGGMRATLTVEAAP